MPGSAVRRCSALLTLDPFLLLVTISITTALLFIVILLRTTGGWRWQAGQLRPTPMLPMWTPCSADFAWPAEASLRNRLSNAYSGLYHFLLPTTVGVYAVNLTLASRVDPRLACHSLQQVPKTSWAIVWSAIERSMLSKFQNCEGAGALLGQRVIVSIESAYREVAERQLCPVLLPSPCSIAVPYPTHFHATSDKTMAEHLELVVKSPRHLLASYGGTARGTQIELRTFLQRECAAAAALDGSCRFIQMKNRSKKSLGGCQNASQRQAIWVDAYLRSEFCLMPPGDSATRQGVFDALLVGCIPVFFASCVQKLLAYETMYDPFLPRHERRQYGPGPWAVLLNVSAVMSTPGYLLNTLRSIPNNTVQAMRGTIVQHLPGLQYSASKLTSYRDAQTIFRQMTERLAAYPPTCRRKNRSSVFWGKGLV